MPFLLNCTNKGCYKTNNHVLDIKSNNVYCIDCDKIIANVSSFTKIQMKSLGQTKKPIKQAYAVRCDNCKNESQPKIDINNNLICPTCNIILKNISRPFEILIRSAIKECDKDI